MPHGEEPVCNREAQVVLVQLDEGRVQLRGFAHTARKGICLELKPATQDRQTERQELQREENTLTTLNGRNQRENTWNVNHLIVGRKDELEDNHQAY